MLRHGPTHRVKTGTKVLLAFAAVLVMLAASLAFDLNPGSRSEADVPVQVKVTILHTNDFHGQLEVYSSNPGAARVAYRIQDIRSTLGAANVLLLDSGDAMQGSLLSNIQKGYPVISVYNAMGYEGMTLGNHDFDWGQTVLSDRLSQAAFPFISANIVTDGPSGWTPPTGVVPYIIKSVGSPTPINVAVIGVTTQETAVLDFLHTTGLTFKDPAESILHYYNEMAAASDVIVVLSHLGFNDGGYGIGSEVYGDKPLAQKLNTAGKPVDLILGGHTHTNLTEATVVGETTIGQAYYNGRSLGKADVTVNPGGSVDIAWSRIAIDTTAPEDAAINDLVDSFVTDPAYLDMIHQAVGYTNVPLIRNYDGDGLMGSFLCDAVYDGLNNDNIPENDVDIVFSNAGSERADLTYGSYPHVITYGELFSVLPFGNSLVVGEMTGAQILDLLNQSATLFKGALHTSGAEYNFYHYRDSLPGPQPWAWGAFDVTVKDKTSGFFDPIDLDKTYRVAANEFLAPAGGDGFTAFKSMKNITYWGDMLNTVVARVSSVYTDTNPYNGALDGRITRDGGNDSASGSIIPLTILHHNDAHGNLVKGSYVGYTQLATLIRQQRLHNPGRTLTLNAGDNFQGDTMMYYFRTAPLGYAADGSDLAPSMTVHPMADAMNLVGYDAITLGEHDFNFGSAVTTSILAQLDTAVVAANIADSGDYGLDGIPVAPYTEKILGGIDVAVVGLTNHNMPRFELPETIEGLTLADPISAAQEYADLLRDSNDVVIALTHLGFTSNTGAEVDDLTDVFMAETVSGLDTIIGGHSHTNPFYGAGDYHALPALVAGPDNMPVLVHQAYRYNNTLGEVILGLKASADGHFDVVSRAGRYHTVSSSTPEAADLVDLLDPYVDMLDDYVNTSIGQTTVPIDTLTGYTEETNGANLQADAAMFKLAKEGVEADFFLAGAMSNRRIAAGATAGTPVTLKVSDVFTLMPYENSLVVLELNGPELQAILERSYRNYYFYKYIPGYGGYSYYTTGMLDISSGGQITYKEVYPSIYDPAENHVLSLTLGGEAVDFTDTETYYKVATVNYLALGNVNFNDGGVSLWPLDQVTAATQYYMRDAVIEYIQSMGMVSPAVEGRLRFLTDWTPPEVVLEVPESGAALQDGVTLTASATDDVAVAGVEFFIREPGGSMGEFIDAAYESIPGIKNTITDKWEAAFDTTLLPDGAYVSLARAEDTSQNEGWSEVVPFTIRNWAVVEMLPASAAYKAGRTVPIKFSIKILPSVDPEEPFVYNEDLTIKIYDVSEPGTPLQVSVYGTKATDYRIEPGLLYITNFATLKKAATYSVEIWRGDPALKIGEFTFATKK